VSSFALLQFVERVAIFYGIFDADPSLVIFS